MAEEKPPSFPPAVEPDEEDEEEPKSTLAPEVAEREAAKAIQEIEEEIEEERPARPPSSPPPRAATDERTFLDKAWDVQLRIESRLRQVGHGRYSRVIKMARKPDPEEYSKATQITGIGIAAIGLVGFLIYLLTKWIWSLLHVR